MLPPVAAPRVWGRVERADTPLNTQLPTHRHVATTLIPPQKHMLVATPLFHCSLTANITPPRFRRVSRELSLHRGRPLDKRDAHHTLHPEGSGACPGSCPHIATIPNLHTSNAHADVHTTPRQARAHNRERRVAPRVWGRVERANSPLNTQLPTHRHVATRGGATGLGARREG